MYKFLAGFGSIVRSLFMVFSHATRKRDTILYPEVPVEQIVPPRFRGRIVLTRDPDGEERCVACNLVRLHVQLAVFHYKKQKKKMGVGIRSFSVSTSLVVFSAVCVKKHVQRQRFK